jgi:hypothetical protein
MTAEMESEAEAQAWDDVVRAWADEARHRAYLDRFTDLEGLASAGRRYRAVLVDRPADPVALRWREEVVRRATVSGFAAIPREKPAWSGVPRWLKALVIAVGVAGLAGWLLAFLFRTFDAFSRGRP